MKNNGYKKILIIGFFLYTMGIFRVLYSDLTNPVYSIYSSMDPLFFLFSISSLLASQFIILKIKNNEILLRNLAFILTSMNMLTFLTYPYLSGTVLMNGEDVATHIGLIRDLGNSGSFNTESSIFYPATHLLSFYIYRLLDVNIYLSLSILSPIICLLLPYIFYSIVNKHNESDFCGSVAFVVGSIFFLSSIFSINAITTPFSISIMFIPFFIYFYVYGVNKKSKNYFPSIIGLLVVTFFILIAHIFTFFLLLISIIFHQTIHSSLSRYYHYSKYSINIGMLLILVTSFFGYLVLITRIWIKPFKSLISVISGNEVVSNYGVDVNGIINKLNWSYLDFVTFLLSSSFHHLILLTFLLLSIIFIYKYKYMNYLFLSSISIFIVGISLTMIQFIMPSLFNISYYRFFIFSIILIPIIISQKIIKIIDTINVKHKLFQNNKNIIINIFCVCLLISMIFSVFTVFPSDRVLQINGQITESEIVSTQWFYDNKKYDIKTYGLFDNSISVRLIGSFGFYNYSIEAINYSDNHSMAVSHFGYGENPQIRDSIKDDRYLITGLRDKFAYLGVYSSLNSFNENDFYKINADQSCDKIYNNNIINIHLIR